MAGRHAHENVKFSLARKQNMKHLSIGALSFFIVLVALFRWAYSENLKFQEASGVSHPIAANESSQAIADDMDKSHATESAGSEPSTDTSTSTLRIDALREQTKNIAACIRLQNHKRIATSLLAQHTDMLNDYARDRMDQNLEMANAQITKLESDGACTGLDINALAGAIYPLLIEMARQGDMEAADCYVAADFELNETQLKPDAIEAYRRNAQSLIRDQMEKGDWRIVELMEAANDRDGDPHRGRYSWFREISAGNPALAYGYNRLLRLGATEDYGINLDRALEARKAELNPMQVAEQDAWAEREYKAHFANAPLINAYVPTCALYSDRRSFHNVLRSR